MREDDVQRDLVKEEVPQGLNFVSGLFALEP